MRPELVLPFPARFELVLHERIPRAIDLPVWELPAGTHPDPQQELAVAPIAEVRPAVGEPWVGIFHAEEARDVPGTLIGWPDERSLCHFGGGGAYLVDASDPRRVTPLGNGLLQQFFVVEEPRVVLFVVDWSRLIAYDGSSLLWESGDLAYDDVVVTGVESGTISCTGFFGARSDVPFTVDLATGEATLPGGR